jgi:hypothetical protein
VIDRNLPPSVSAFARAVGWGSLAAAAPFFLISVPIGMSSLFSDNYGSEWWFVIYFMLVPLLITLPIVLTASLVLGLPLTALLSESGAEKGQHYVAAGVLIGAVPLFILFMDVVSAAALLSFGGALGGGVTGWVWGRHRDELAASRAPD